MPDPAANAGFVSPQVRALQTRGVAIPHPDSVYVEDSVNPTRFAPGVVIHPGCRLSGARTSAGPGCVLGEEAPATIQDCQLGHQVQLKGGFFSGSTFLDGCSVGSCAHLRPSSLMEEQSSAAHSVGLKNTILLPFVTLGSQINFCDCLMAGGTDRRNHSEVGSSFVHFNFTPHQDKATPSLIGDVPAGVMLDQAPIFLGGHSGLVGPVRVAYGTVLPAGIVGRRDILRTGLLVASSGARSGVDIPYETGIYGDITRSVTNNLIYIGNLMALLQWYHWVRRPAAAQDPFRMACVEGAQARLRANLDERITRLGDLASRMERSLELAGRQSIDLNQKPFVQQKAFSASWPVIEPKIRAALDRPGNTLARDTFLAAWEKRESPDYLVAISRLSAGTRQAGTEWLQSIVDLVAQTWPAKPGTPG